MIRTLFIAFCILFASLLHAEPESAHYDAIFEQGNDLYKAENYEDALATYRQIEEAGYVSPQAFYNMGNCYFKTNEIASAILYYERALLLKPNDPDIQFNLDLANEQTEDQIEALPELFFVSWWRNISQWQSDNGWSITLILLAFVTAALILLFRLTQQAGMRKLLLVATLATVSLSIVAILLGYTYKNALTAQEYGIVFAASLPVMTSPNDNGDPAFVLHEGTKVKVLQTDEGWYEISFPGGDKGWVPGTSIVRI